MANTSRLVSRLSEIPGVRPMFDSPYFHEAVLRFDCPVAPVLEALAERDVLGGYDLSEDFPELGQALLVCATETKLEQDIDEYARALGEIMRKAQVA
jgi:glycine dehydrogenase subunit 1